MKKEISSRMKFLVMMSVFFLTSLLGIKVNAQAPALTVGYIMNEFESSANNVIHNADYALNKNINVAALNILNVISQFKDAYSSMLDKTSNELSKQQQTLFNHLETSIQEVFYNIENANEKIDDSLANLSLYLSGTVFGDKTPRITRFNFSTLIRGTNDRIVIEFEGVCLNNPNNYLQINDEKIAPAEYTDKSLKFLVNTSVFQDYSNQNPEVIFENIYLTCLYKAGWFIFGKEKSKPYKFLVQTLPKKLGTFTYEYTDSIMKRVVEDKERYHFEREVQSSGLGSSRSRTYTDMVVPDSGWKINTASVRAWEERRTTNCRTCNISVNNLSETGYRVDLYLRSTSQIRATCRARAYSAFQQYKDVSVYEVRKTEAYDLDAGIDKSFDLPENLISFKRLMITLFNGRQIVFTNSDRHEFVEFKCDLVNKTVTVKSDYKLYNK